MSSYPGRGPQIKDVRKQTELICPPLPPTWGDFFHPDIKKDILCIKLNQVLKLMMMVEAIILMIVMVILMKTRSLHSLRLPHPELRSDK